MGGNRLPIKDKAQHRESQFLFPSISSQYKKAQLLQRECWWHFCRENLLTESYMWHNCRYVRCRLFTEMEGVVSSKQERKRKAVFENLRGRAFPMSCAAIGKELVARGLYASQRLFNGMERL
jgi:hypothetical protein